MKKSELKQLIREVIEEINGKYWDVDLPLGKDAEFNILVGDQIPKKNWFSSYITHVYYNKEEDALRLDGHYKTIDGSGKGKFAVFVKDFVKGNTKIGAETLGDVRGHWSGDISDAGDVPDKPTRNLYISWRASGLLKYMRGAIKAGRYDELPHGIWQVSRG
jgi:hypothetical protein